MTLLTRPYYKLAVDTALREQGIIIPHGVNDTWRFIEECWKYNFPPAYAVAYIAKHGGTVPKR